MTVRATASISQSDTSSATFYSIAFHLSAVDDTVGSTHNASVTLEISYDLKPRKADDAIRQGLADFVSSNFGLVVDPDDIYFPMTN